MTSLLIVSSRRSNLSAVTCGMASRLTASFRCQSFLLQSSRRSSTSIAGIRRCPQLGFANSTVSFGCRQWMPPLSGSSQIGGRSILPNCRIQKKFLSISSRNALMFGKSPLFGLQRNNATGIRPQSGLLLTSTRLVSDGNGNGNGKPKKKKKKKKKQPTADASPSISRSVDEATDSSIPEERPTAEAQSEGSGDESSEPPPGDGYGPDAVQHLKRDESGALSTFVVIKEKTQETFSLLYIAGILMVCFPYAFYLVFKSMFSKDSPERIKDETFDMLRDDSRVRMALGNDVMCKAHLNSATFVDGDGNDRLQVIYEVSGSKGDGRVDVEMLREDKEWSYQYVIVSTNYSVIKVLDNRGAIGFQR